MNWGLSSRGTEYLSQDTVDIELATFLELRSGAKIGWLWGLVVCWWRVGSLGFQTPCFWRYLDPKNIPIKHRTSGGRTGCLGVMLVGCLVAFNQLITIQL